MNILFLDQFAEIGGAQQCMLDVLPALQQKGWRVQAALPGEGRFSERLRAANVPVTSIRCGPYRSGRKSFIDAARLAFDIPSQNRVIARMLAERRFDVIYVNGPRLMPAVARAAGKSLPVLFHAHNRVSHKRSLDLLGRSLAACGAKVVACCEFVAQPLRKYVTGGNVSVSPNGVPDMRLDTGVDSRFRGPGFRIGIVGRIEPEKGQVEFLQAAEILSHSGLSPRFVICGLASPLAGDYAKRVGELGSRLSVEFTGWKDDVRGILNSLDLLVIASTNEGLPRVMLEAFSAGVPVVAFPAGGIPEAIQDNVTGVLTTEYSAVSLASRIRELLENRALRQAIAINARRLWEKSYGLSLYRSRITAHLSDLVAAAAAP